MYLATAVLICGTLYYTGLLRTPWAPEFTLTQEQIKGDSDFSTGGVQGDVDISYGEINGLPEIDQSKVSNENFGEFKKSILEQITT